MATRGVGVYAGMAGVGGVGAAVFEVCENGHPQRLSAMRSGGRTLGGGFGVR